MNTHSVNVKSGCRTLKKKKSLQVKHQCFPCIWYVTIFRRRNQIRKRCYSQEALDALNSIFWGCRYGLTQGGSEPVGFWPQALEWRPALENRVQAPRVTQGPTPHPPTSAEAPRPHPGMTHLLQPRLLALIQERAGLLARAVWMVHTCCLCICRLPGGLPPCDTDSHSGLRHHLHQEAVS